MRHFWLLLLLLLTAAASGYTSRTTSRCSRLCHCYYQSLFCRGYNYNSIPADVGSDVENIDFQDNNLQEISNETLAKFPDLRKLLLGGNNISNIDEGAFRKQKLLNALDLSANRLSKIPVMAFDPIRKKLEHLTLQGNSIVKIEGTFQRMRVLKTLNLKDNKIQLLTAETLFQNRKIRYLQLADNEIDYISPDSLKRQTELKYLFLDNNNLENVTVFKIPSKKLQSVSLSNCQLKEIPTGVSRTVQQLNLAGNRLTLLEENNISMFKSLQSLDLSRNLLANISERAFRPLLKLKLLYLGTNQLQEVPKKLPGELQQITLDHNRISDLPKEAFVKVKRLQALTLKNNMIEYIHKKTFSGLTELRTLDLSSNVITRISSNLFSDLVGLKDLYLSHNPLLIIDSGAMDGLWSLDTLSLDNMDKSVRTQGVLLPDSPQLRTLNIQNSRSITRSLLENDLQMYSLKSVEYLNIMQNNLRTLPATFPQFLPNLQRIQLSSNPWNCNRHLYWLRVWLVNGGVEEPHLLHITCDLPKHLKGRQLIDLDAYDWVSSDPEYI
ncbi:chondroadherin-like [Watersipora subatra]|uniref:chondroadherin-like n=1 Tax=Watersipora subatra TaxID=2589382 RepID=UPI00355B2809